MRVWLPDRPGALGAVASRIGAVRGDVIAIDVLERGGGRAVDELTVSLADPSLIDLLVTEIGEVDGVDVELVRPHHGDGTDRAVQALSVARELVEVRDPHDLLRVLCRDVCELLGADWVAAVDTDHSYLMASAGAAPDEGWLVAFVGGLEADQGVVDELAYSVLDSSVRGFVVVSRRSVPLRGVERATLDELVAIAQRRLADLAPT